MTKTFSVPEEYWEAFQRLAPHIPSPLHENHKVMQTLLIYLKLGGEKLARIALEAFHETYWLNEIQMRKQLQDELILRDMREKDEEDEEEDEDIESENED